MSKKTDHQIDVERALDGLDHLNGKGDPAKVLEAYEGTILQERLARKARQRVDAQEQPDFAAHLKDGNALAALHQEEADRHLIQNVTDWGSTTLLTAPTNSGGSTLLLHMAYCLLTGHPFLGTLDVEPGPFTVLWINPEEKETTPVSRLKDMGATPEQLARFTHLHTRDQRLYFNRSGHVTALLEAIDAMGLPDLPLVIFVDGFTPTLKGVAWNEDLEAWKDGVGRVRDQLQPVAFYVRAQITASGQRASKKFGAKLTAEDAQGGQITQWPDNRLTLNRVKDSENRTLTVRGRLQDGEWDMTYEWDPQTYHLQSITAMASTWAVIAVQNLLRGDEWRTLGLISKRKVAQHIEAEFAGKDDAPSFRTIQRVLEGWEYVKEDDKWQRN